MKYTKVEAVGEEGSLLLGNLCVNTAIRESFHIVLDFFNFFIFANYLQVIVL